MPIMFYGEQILFDDSGAIVFDCEGNCCSDPPPLECSDLCEGETQPASINITFGGVTDSGCVSCASTLNALFNVLKTGDCLYVKSSIAVGSCTDPFFGGQLYATIQVNLVSDGVQVVLQVGAFGAVTFKRTLSGPLDCSADIFGAAAYVSGALASGCGGGSGMTCTIS